jgi:hypothetical protein
MQKNDRAIVFNKITKAQLSLTAAEVEELYLGNGSLNIVPQTQTRREDLEFTNRFDGEPILFRRSHYRDGSSRVMACWVTKDDANETEHIFDSDYESFQNRVSQGEPLLLKLNLKLTSNYITFEHMKGHGARSYESWKADKNNSYIGVSVSSIQDTIQALNKFCALAGRDSGSRIFALHMGAVVPFGSFFIGTRHKIKNLYNDMTMCKGGVKNGNNEFVGFPRLMPFIPTGTTTEHDAEKWLHGNFIKADKGKPHITQLVGMKRSLKDLENFNVLRDSITGDGAIYVLASPKIKINSDWKLSHMAVGNIKSQTLPIDAELREKLLRHLDLEERMPYRVENGAKPLLE